MISFSFKVFSSPPIMVVCGRMNSCSKSSSAGKFHETNSIPTTLTTFLGGTELNLLHATPRHTIRDHSRTTNKAERPARQIQTHHPHNLLSTFPRWQGAFKFFLCNSSDCHKDELKLNDFHIDSGWAKSRTWVIRFHVEYLITVIMTLKVQICIFFAARKILLVTCVFRGGIKALKLDFSLINITLSVKG